MLFDDAVEGAGEAAEKVSGAILDLCIEHGGSITGEHGVGMDKAKYMPRMYTDDDLDTMQLVRCAFDPDNISNPGKVFPTPRLCGEVPGRQQGRPPAAGSRPGGGVLMSGATTLDATAREAVASACADVRDPRAGRPRRRGRARAWSPGPPTPSRSPRCSARPPRTG